VGKAKRAHAAVLAPATVIPDESESGPWIGTLSVYR